MHIPDEVEQAISMDCRTKPAIMTLMRPLTASQTAW